MARRESTVSKRLRCLASEHVGVRFTEAAQRDRAERQRQVPPRKRARIAVDVARLDQQQRNHCEKEVRRQQHRVQLPVGRLIAANPNRPSRPSATPDPGSRSRADHDRRWMVRRRARKRRRPGDSLVFDSVDLWASPNVGSPARRLRHRRPGGGGSRVARIGCIGLRLDVRHQRPAVPGPTTDRVPRLPDDVT
jgi:hypothetical protein